MVTILIGIVIPLLALWSLRDPIMLERTTWCQKCFLALWPPLHESKPRSQKSTPLGVWTFCSAVACYRFLDHSRLIEAAAGCHVSLRPSVIEVPALGPSQLVPAKAAARATPGPGDWTFVWHPGFSSCAGFQAFISGTIVSFRHLKVDL
jgi:hypothetical protein